jgi:parallel beta-helix repeat protein
MGNMHKSKEITIFIICFLILSSLFVLFNDKPCKASGETIWVDIQQRYPDYADGTQYNPFKYIQSAISAADDGDTIKVLKGTYGGELTIDKSVTIVSEDVTKTFITGGSQDAYLIDITADSVSLEGFKIQDTTTTSHRKAVVHIAPGTSDVVIINNRINHSANGRGIYLDNTYKAVIKNNIVNDTYGGGIIIENSNSNALGVHTLYGNYVGNFTANPALRIISSNENHMENNVFRNSTNGIYIQNSGGNYIKSNKIFCNSNSGIALSTGSLNTVENSSIYNNGNIGIDLSSSQSNIIKNNIYGNGIDISLGASNCIIRENSIHHSRTYGIYAGTNSRDNMIYNNTFHIKTGMYHAKEDGSNYWDNGSIGNYWADFYGPDPTSSSTLDTLKDEDFYYTEGGVYDKHPKGVFQKPPQITDPSPAHLATSINRQTSLGVKVVDPQGWRMDIYFYYILDNVSHLIESNNNVESGKTASVSFFSTEGSNKGYTYQGLGYDYIGIWYVVVKNQYSQTKSPEWIFSTLNVPISNKKPTADAGGSYAGQIGDEIHFDGSGCNDVDGTIVFYRWSFGDGTSVINVQSPTHVYKNAPDKPYDVSLVVIDNQGSSDTSSTTVAIESQENRPPVAKVSGPSTGNAGDSIQFSGGESLDLDSGDAIVSYVWDFGDGTNGTDQSINHAYSKPGKYIVTLIVTDIQGAYDSDSINVEINAATSKKTPGYELIFAIIAILLVLALRRRR